MRYGAILLAAACMTTTGCIKMSPGSVTIKGRLVKDCSLEPVPNAKVQFHSDVSSGLFSKAVPTQIGETVTDAQGGFIITLPNETLETINMYYASMDQPNEYKRVVENYRWPKRPEVGSTYDWGFLYIPHAPYPVKLVLNMQVDEKLRGADSLFVWMSPAVVP